MSKINRLPGTNQTKVHAKFQVYTLMRSQDIVRKQSWREKKKKKKKKKKKSQW